MKTKFLCLTILLVVQQFVMAQDTIFFDDFETGNANRWEYEEGWSVFQEGDNFVFEGQGHKWARPMIYDFYKNSTFQARVRFIEGGFHFNLLMKNLRYFFPVSPEGIQFFDGDSMILDIPIHLDLDKWHIIKAVTDSSNMKFYINDSLYIDYQDNSRPEIAAVIAFECIDNICIDDVLIFQHRAEGPSIQKYSWYRTGGPLGGIGYDVRIDPTDPDIIYVTDQWSGCHKSYDGGQSWHPKNDGITSRFGPTNDAIPIFCLTIDGNDPNIVWCGTFGMRGVYKSINKGENWEKKTNGIPNTGGITFRSFAIEPGNSDVVYCGVEIGLPKEEVPQGQSSASIGKIYKTTDGGENWEEVLHSNALVRTIIIDPNNTSIVYAATGIFDRDDVHEEGIWKSTDAGETWFHINNGITNLTVGDIEMHPTNSNILFAACGRIRGFGGGENAEVGEVLLSEDGGNSWVQKMGGQDFRPFTYVEIDESDPEVVYAAASDRGFYKSIDGGYTWHETTYNPPYINPGHIISVATHESMVNWLITNSYGGGVFISEDGADSWKDASKGYTGCEITDLAVSPVNAHVLYTVARSSIFKSTDGGENWHGIGASVEGFGGVPMGELELRSIAVNPQKPNEILYGTGFGINEIIKSTDYGSTWNRVYSTDSDDITAISYAPSNPLIIYAGFTIGGGYQIDRPYPFDPTQESRGIIRSTDGGKTWEYKNTGLENSYKNITCIAVDPQNENIVYIGTLNSGIYKSTDRGESWQQSSDGIIVKDIRSIVIDENHTDILYAGTQRGGLYKTIDAGVTWQPKVYGMDPEAAIRSIVINPQDPQAVYAADWQSGVYESTDGGETWHHMNDGLRTRAVQRLAITADGSILYAGTQGEGVFRLALKQMPPVIGAVSPDTSSTITIQKGETLCLSVVSFDINNDPISYSWSLEGKALASEDTSNLCLHSDTLEIKEYSLELTVSDSLTNAKIRWNISVTDKQSQIETAKHSGIKVYPNPLAGNLLYFDVREGFNLETFTIYTIAGQKVLEMSYSGQPYIDFSHLPAGVYLLYFEYSNDSQVFKVIR